MHLEAVVLVILFLSDTEDGQAVVWWKFKNLEPLFMSEVSQRLCCNAFGPLLYKQSFLPHNWRIP